MQHLKKRLTRVVSMTAATALLLSACGSGLISVTDLAVGHCFDDPSDSEEIAFIQTIECDEPHQNEVYASVELTQFDAFPGQSAIDDAAVLECLDEFEPFVGAPYETSSLDIAFLTPTEESWNDGDHDVACALYDLNGQLLVGSVKGTGK